MSDFSHIDPKGQVQMVDVTAKSASERRAVARGQVRMRTDTLRRMLAGKMKKGAVLETARIAGIMAAKKTAEVIPLCHPLALSHVRIDFSPDPNAGTVEIEAAVRVHSATGVEMEALTAVSVAALTIYDMCKAIDREMVISGIRLMEKSGGRSGTFQRSRKNAGDRASV